MSGPEEGGREGERAKRTAKIGMSGASMGVKMSERIRSYWSGHGDAKNGGREHSGDEREQLSIRQLSAALTNGRRMVTCRSGFTAKLMPLGMTPGFKMSPAKGRRIALNPSWTI